MQIPTRQVAPTGRAPASTGNYFTGEALAAPGRALGQAARNVTGAFGELAQKQENIDFVHTQAALVDRTSEWLATQSKNPVLDDNGIPKEIDPQTTIDGVDQFYNQLRESTKHLSQDNQQRVEMWLLGRRDNLINQSFAIQEQAKKEFYRTNARQRAFTLMRNGNEMDGTRFIEAAKAAYPDQVDQIEQAGSEGQFWGIVEHQGGREAVKFLKTNPPGLDPERRMQLAEAAERYDKALGARHAAMTLEQQKAAHLQAVDKIDANDTGTAQFIQSLPPVPPGTKKKKDVVDQNTLQEWHSNRNNVVETDYDTGMELLGEAIAAASNADQYDVRMKLAQARYSDKAKLSQEAYDQIKTVLTKGYKPHEAGAIKAGYDAINTQMQWRGGQGWFGGGFVPRPAEERSEQMGKLLSWFDGEREKNLVPSEIQVYTKAKELGVQIAPRPTLTGTSGLDDPALPEELKTKILRLREMGYSDAIIMDTQDWQTYRTAGGRK